MEADADSRRLQQTQMVFYAQGIGTDRRTVSGNVTLKTKTPLEKSGGVFISVSFNP